MIHDKTQGNLLIDFYGELLTDRQNEVLSHYYSDDLSMQEIADELGLSRAVVNKIFTELKEAGYISMVTRGKWKLSEQATEMIRVTQRL